MKRLVLATILLASCSPAQQQQAVTTAVTVHNDIGAACAEAMPLAALATPLPVAGPFIAAGVQVACATHDGIARLAADPNSAAWLQQQAAMLKAALSKAGIKA